MKKTKNLNLNLPDGDSFFDIEHFNQNAEIIDENIGELAEFKENAGNELKKTLQKTGDASEVTVAFEQASSRTNITPGEKLKTTLSKIKKWFADLKTVAFTGSYNDLTNKPTSLPASGGNADSVLDVKDGRKTYMNYASDCVTNFDYFAVWNPNNPNTGDVELRAYNKANVADAIGALLKSGGAMTGTITAVAGRNSDSYSSTALNMNNSNITGVNGIYTADPAEEAAEGINFYRTATTVDSLYAQNGTLYFGPGRPLGGTSQSYYIPGRQFGSITKKVGNVANGSCVYKEINDHGHLHLAMTGVSCSASTWTTIATATKHPVGTTHRGHVIIADGAYTLSGAERTGCTFGNNGEVSIISPVAFSGKDVYIDVFW